MKKRRQHRQKTQYSMLDELFASPTQPLPAEFRRHQLTRMWGGLAAIETAPDPTQDDWGVCSDAVNLMKTLIQMGEVEDSGALLQDAIQALVNAGRRYVETGKIRLDAPGIQAVRAVLEDYAAVIDVLPARTMIRCHRLTEQAILDIQAGKSVPDAVVIKV